MKTITIKRTILYATALLMSSSLFAQEEKKFEIAPAADLVSSYVSSSVHGLRVTPRVEEEGLDIYEHGETAYNS